MLKYLGGERDPEQFADLEPERIPEWLAPIVLAGPRPAFEMEQVIPGADPEDDSDAIIESTELRDSGMHREALDLLMGLCREDLRCLDAHAHLGNLRMDSLTEIALRHYAVGVAIGGLSLPAWFDGVLSWDQVRRVVDRSGPTYDPS